MEISLGVEETVMEEFRTFFLFIPSKPTRLTRKRKLISTNQKPVLASITSSLFAGTAVESLLQIWPPCGVRSE
jgi:hypothetical protein